MKRLAGIIFVLSLGLLSLQSAKESSAQNGAQQPELIGEGTVSTPDDELAGNITADGTTLYFEESAPPHYLYILYESQLVKGKWQKPTVLPFSGQYKTQTLSFHRTIKHSSSRRTVPWRASTAITSTFGQQRKQHPDGPNHCFYPAR
jgi:hypothetical protein